MEHYRTNSKKKLDFSRPTFDEPDFKIPRSHEQSNESDLSHNPSEKADFADDEESSRDSESSAASSITTEKVSVYLRLKPTKEIPDVYKFDETLSKVTVQGNQANNLTSIERQYTFSSIFKDDTDQKAVYNKTVRSILQDPFASTGTVFACYGVSNSGKTYTILGEKSPGIVPRALTQLFCEYNDHIAQFPCIKVINDQITILSDEQVELEMDMKKDFIKEARKIHKGKLDNDWIEMIKEDHQFAAKQSTVDYQQVYIWISFVEIHNEKLIDLFKQQKDSLPHPLKIISNNHNSYVHGLTWLHVSSIDNAFELLQHGLRRIKYAATGVNAHSSRSHTIFNINLISECDSNFEFTCYKFCDLAGAERISKTGNVGERLKETGGINSSLMVLGRCLEAVQESQKPGVKKNEIRVPVRESKLTFLLQSSLLGREKFVMIVNLLPSLECFSENINVLHFGSIANRIVTRKLNARKYSRGSSRYTYFMQHAVGSPKMNSSLILEESLTDRDESSLDLSYQRNQMSADELRHELLKKDTECHTLRMIIEEKEREFLRREAELRQESSRTQGSTREKEKKYYEEKEQIMKNYYEKKMESITLKHKRQLKEVIDENDYLEHENKKLKRKLGMTAESDDIIDLDEEDQENQSPD